MGTYFIQYCGSGIKYNINYNYGRKKSWREWFSKNCVYNIYTKRNVNERNVNIGVCLVKSITESQINLVKLIGRNDLSLNKPDIYGTLPVNLNNVVLNDMYLAFAILNNAKLGNAILRRASLIHSNLTNAILIKANLISANLTDAILTNAKLGNAKLGRAILTRANLTDAILTRANLTNAILISANLTNAILINAKLTNVNFTDAIFPNIMEKN